MVTPEGDLVHVRDRPARCKAKAPNNLPMVVGTKWVYDQDGKEVSEEVIHRVEEDGARG